MTGNLSASEQIRRRRKLYWDIEESEHDLEEALNEGRQENADAGVQPKAPTPKSVKTQKSNPKKGIPASALT